MRGGPLIKRDGHWRQVDRKGNCLWPRTFRDDHGVRHAVILSFDNGMEGPVLMCTGHRAHKTGVDEDYRPLTCLVCIVRDPWFPDVEPFEED